MDFWSRLLSHTPLSTGPSRKDIAKDPLRRRHRFEKEYGQLLQTWRNSSNLVHDIGAADTIELRIQELTDILIDESRRPLPHTCLGFASEKQIYVPIGKIAATSYNLNIVKEAVYFFGTLIESEDDAFVEAEIFASNLTNLFVRITGANSIRLDAETETKVVELAFNITTKIRLRPEILPAWFKTRDNQQSALQQTLDAAGDDKEKESEDHERFKGKTQRKDFPLFYILMDYIHAEGKIGDFARTGLLYIIESASAASSASLEQWIVESDLSTLMATGLGALYSQLSRKLVIDHPTNNLPPVLALSDYEHPRPAFEAVSSCSSDFQVQLDTFLSHLLFWQDVLNHCRSIEVRSTLLEHFQVIFLQQLLYPSLLESSDIDGGSSVAVLTYLRRIIESVDHPDMINLILHYLLALPNPTGMEPASSKTAVSAARKRKSMDLATMMAERVEVAATPVLFNLVDLILACLKSHSHQTICVTLQLVSTILRRHHRYAVMTLIRTGPVSGNFSRRTIGAHQQDVEFFMSLAGVVGGQDNFDEVYDGILRDMVVRLESHPCSLKIVAPKVSTNNHDLPSIPDSLPGAPRDVVSHSIRPDDPLLATILDRLETFFVNPVDANLSATDAILDLCTCGFVSLEGWVVRHPDNYVIFEASGLPSATGSNSGPEGDGCINETAQAAAFMGKCQERPKWNSLPRLLTVLQTLIEQVRVYRQTIPRFDDLLQQRREAFQTADSKPPVPLPRNRTMFSNSSNGVGPDNINTDDTKSDSFTRPSVFENFAQRLLSELGTPSRSGSPRGGKDSSRGGFTTPAHGNNDNVDGGNFVDNGHGSRTVTVSGGYGISTPISTKAIPVVPGGFALATDISTLPKSSHEAYSVHSSSPGSQRGVAVSWDGQGERDGLVASQMAAFQAVDRKILARQVGMPEARVDSLPISTDFAARTVPSKMATIDARFQSDGQEEKTCFTSAGPSSVPAFDDGDPASSEGKTVTVSHILTNVVILQSFLFEIAAMLQARAGLFDEVRFV